MTEQYFKLRNEISYLRDKIICYNKLFNESKDDFDNIVKFSSGFFGFFQEEIRDSIILHIGRLFDNKRNVFSIWRFIKNAFDNKIDLREKHYIKYDELRKKLKPIIDWRNNFVAHINYEMTFRKEIMSGINNEELIKAIDEITEFFHLVEEDFTDNHVRIGFEYSNSRMKMDIHRVIKKVKRANAYSKLCLYGMYDLSLEDMILKMDNKELKKRIANNAVELIRPATD